MLKGLAVFAHGHACTLEEQFLRETIRFVTAALDDHRDGKAAVREHVAHALEPDFVYFVEDRVPGLLAEAACCKRTRASNLFCDFVNRKIRFACVAADVFQRSPYL